jgi:ketosteroid isomerase-like protein
MTTVGPHTKGQEMSDTMQSAEDLAILERLNLDYVEADQASDATRFSELLAEDFVVQTPVSPAVVRSSSSTSPSRGPSRISLCTTSKVRILGDVALIHGRSTYTMLANSAEQEALYTDAYQKRDGSWVCVSACAIAPGT